MAIKKRRLGVGSQAVVDGGKGSDIYDGVTVTVVRVKRVRLGRKIYEVVDETADPKGWFRREELK